MVLSGTQELHERIDDLYARNRDLEDALKTLQGQLSDEPHPLLCPDALRPRSKLTTRSPQAPIISSCRTEYSSDESPLASPEMMPESAAVISPPPPLDDPDFFGR